MAVNNKFVHFETWTALMEKVNNDYTTHSSIDEDGIKLYGQIKGTSIVFIKDVGKIWTHGRLYNDDEEITIDSAISATSTNPVQNKVIKTYVDGLHSAIPTADITALFA